MLMRSASDAPGTDGAGCGFMALFLQMVLEDREINLRVCA